MSQRPLRGYHVASPKKSTTMDSVLVLGSPNDFVRSMSGSLQRSATPTSADTSQINLLEPQTLKGQQETGKRDNRVQVAVRLRPWTKADGPVHDICLVADGDFGLKIMKPGTEKDEKRFYYDHVFTAGQEEVYDCIGRPMLRDAAEGYNVTLFAYGQTGSGKTWSTIGPEGSPSNSTLAGILPRFCRDLLTWAERSLEVDATLSIKIALSMLEIYNEKVRDLLEKKKGSELAALEIHETKERKIFVEGLSLHTVTNYDRFLSLTQKGLAQRQVHETNMNETSSRSHCILQIYLTQTHDPPRADMKDVESVINIVDLAGSERQGKTSSTGERFEESKKINHSLMMLGRALNTFSDCDGKSDFVPLRDSKLTRLLSESFGGNARTWMLACVSPSAYNYHESLSTLQYAQNAKAIVNKAKVNAMREKLELKQLQQKYMALEQLYDAEREKNQQLMLELQNRGEHIQWLQRQLDRALLGQMAPARPLAVYIPGMYIGRAHLHLKNILRLTSNYVTLPLITDRADCDGAVLMVTTYPLKKMQAAADDAVELKDLMGKPIELIVHVIGVKNIPAAYSQVVYCKYVFRHAEKDVYQTQQLSGQSAEFDFKKRFAFGCLTEQLADYLSRDNVLTFEVLGKGPVDRDPPSPDHTPPKSPFTAEAWDA
eukprot:GGOE01036664.1.p1 GENE.GGOE01036664.1~~GGOE01036664.1.p1  ORF type:complete len:672 (-),score=199.84 GGOE01036664.1:138-2111(-)